MKIDLLIRALAYQVSSWINPQYYLMEVGLYFNKVNIKVFFLRSY